jgi:hypothetical protein
MKSTTTPLTIDVDEPTRRALIAIATAKRRENPCAVVSVSRIVSEALAQALRGYPYDEEGPEGKFRGFLGPVANPRTPRD